MKSEDINKIISAYDERDDIPYESCIGEKIIPYIGWSWRTVNFDRGGCWLGILPIYKGVLESNDSEKVGFMENNKWGYDGFEVEGENWVELRQLIVAAAKTPSHDNFKAVDDKMQSLLKGR